MSSVEPQCLYHVLIALKFTCRVVSLYPAMPRSTVRP
jgi:hypothetical protein